MANTQQERTGKTTTVTNGAGTNTVQFNGESRTALFAKSSGASGLGVVELDTRYKLTIDGKAQPDPQSQEEAEKLIKGAFPDNATIKSTTEGHITKYTIEFPVNTGEFKFPSPPKTPELNQASVDQKTKWFNLSQEQAKSLEITSISAEPIKTENGVRTYQLKGTIPGALDVEYTGTIQLGNGLSGKITNQTELNQAVQRLRQNGKNVVTRVRLDGGQTETVEINSLSRRISDLQKANKTFQLEIQVNGTVPAGTSYTTTPQTNFLRGSPVNDYTYRNGVKNVRFTEVDPTTNTLRVSMYDQPETTVKLDPGTVVQADYGDKGNILVLVGDGADSKFQQVVAFDPSKASRIIVGEGNPRQNSEGTQAIDPKGNFKSYNDKLPVGSVFIVPQTVLPGGEQNATGEVVGVRIEKDGKYSILSQKEMEKKYHVSPHKLKANAEKSVWVLTVDQKGKHQDVSIHTVVNGNQTTESVTGTLFVKGKPTTEQVQKQAELEKQGITGRTVTGERVTGISRPDMLSYRGNKPRTRRTSMSFVTGGVGRFGSETEIEPTTLGLIETEFLPGEGDGKGKPTKVVNIETKPYSVSRTVEPNGTVTPAGVKTESGLYVFGAQVTIKGVDGKETSYNVFSPNVTTDLAKAQAGRKALSSQLNAALKRYEQAQNKALSNGVISPREQAQIGAILGEMTNIGVWGRVGEMPNGLKTRIPEAEQGYVLTKLEEQFKAAGANPKRQALFSIRDDGNRTTTNPPRDLGTLIVSKKDGKKVLLVNLRPTGQILEENGMEKFEGLRTWGGLAESVISNSKPFSELDPADQIKYRQTIELQLKQETDEDNRASLRNALRLMGQK